MATQQPKYNVGDLVQIQDIRDLKNKPFMQFIPVPAIVLEVKKNHYCSESVYLIYDIINAQYSSLFESSIYEWYFRRS